MEIRPRKYLPSFTLALSTLLEEPEASSSRRSSLSQNRGAGDEDNLMQTSGRCRRGEEYFEYPVILQDDDFEVEDENYLEHNDGGDVYGFDYDEYESDLETEVDDHCGDGSLSYSESVTVYDEPSPRAQSFMFLRRLTWKILRRCPECGEKLDPLDLPGHGALRNKKSWIGSIFSGTKAQAASQEQ